MKRDMDGQGRVSNVKAESRWSRRHLLVLFLLWTFALAVRGDIVYHQVTYPPDVAGGWPSVDFDGDGAPETSFQLEALGFETGGVMFLYADTSPSAEMLIQNGGVLALDAGTAISPSTTAGQWQAGGAQSMVWDLPYSSPFLGDTNVVSPAPPAQGVGMPGCGQYMGVRFLIGSDWHYGWVRFGALGNTSSPSAAPSWPSVLEYAYERRPGVQILAGSKPVPVSLANPAVVRPGYLRLTWPAQVGIAYQVQVKNDLTAFAWTNLSFTLPAATTNVMVDLPTDCQARFFRVIEAD